MVEVTIRRAAPADVGGLSRLAAQVQALHVAHRPDQFKVADAEALAPSFAAPLQNDSATVWVAELENAVIGYATVVVRTRPDGPFCPARTWWQLDSIGVSAEHRRKGVARALLETIRREARAAQISDIELNSWAFNESAHEAFRRLGFSPKSVQFELRVDEPPSEGAAN